MAASGLCRSLVYSGLATLSLTKDRRSDDTVVILHTGGLPALFTFADELWEHEFSGV